MIYTVEDVEKTNGCVYITRTTMWSNDDGFCSISFRHGRQILYKIIDNKKIMIVYRVYHNDVLKLCKEYNNGAIINTMTPTHSIFCTYVSRTNHNYMNMYVKINDNYFGIERINDVLRVSKLLLYKYYHIEDDILIRNDRMYRDEISNITSPSSLKTSMFNHSDVVGEVVDFKIEDTHYTICDVIATKNIKNRKYRSEWCGLVKILPTDLKQFTPCDDVVVSLKHGISLTITDDTLTDMISTIKKYNMNKELTDFRDAE